MRAEDQDQDRLSNPDEEIPAVIHIDLTPKYYQEDKERILKRYAPLLRRHIRELFSYYRNLDPDSVIDAIEENETIGTRYEDGRLQERLPVAAARGYLRVASQKIRRQAKSLINVKDALTILRFENPLVYQVIKTFGDKGTGWLEKNTADLIKMLKLDE